MNRLKFYTNYIINYDLLLKFKYKNSFQFIKFDKICLNLGCKTMEKKEMLLIILLLELVTGQKSTITKSTKNKISLKIKKGMIVGCKVTLRNLALFNFFEKLIIFYFPNIKDFFGIRVENKNVSFKINNCFEIFELTTEFLRFGIKQLDVVICLRNFNRFYNTRGFLSFYSFPILRE